MAGPLRPGDPGSGVRSPDQNRVFPGDHSQRDGPDCGFLLDLLRQPPLESFRAEGVTGGAGRIFLAGLALDLCVRYSAGDALEFTAEIFVIEDACRGVAEKSVVETK